jgi:hypothetical protein
MLIIRTFREWTGKKREGREGRREKGERRESEGRREGTL